ncbi:MAG: hypothetical protein HKN91_03265 [Acidimicrobiia bacterium]|nr:hypothetical protein [Acidimicrobiia bacterium]
MSWWERFVAIFKSEAADVKEGLQKAGKSISDELDRKQAELDAEPHERVDMLMEEADQADKQFEELEDRIKGDQD